MATESKDPEDAPGSNATSEHFHQQRFWDVATPQQKITTGITPREVARYRLSGAGCHRQRRERRMQNQDPSARAPSHSVGRAARDDKREGCLSQG